MEEAQRILLSSLEQSGISLPTGVSSIREMAPHALVSICSQSLNLIDPSISFPTSLPISTTERVKICTEIASFIKALGYRGDLSFHQFIYPSSVDAYNLVRFLVERLSRLSGSIKLDGEREVISRYEKHDTFSAVVGDPLRGWMKRPDNHEVDQYDQTVHIKSSFLRIGSLGNGHEKKTASNIMCQANASLEPPDMDFDKCGLSTVGSSEPFAAPIKKDLSPDACPVGLTVGLSSNEQLEQGILQSYEQDHMLVKGHIPHEGKLLDEGEETKAQVSMGRVLDNQKGDAFIGQNEKSNFLLEKSRMFQEKELTPGASVDSLNTQRSTSEIGFADRCPSEFPFEELGKQQGVKKNSLLELQSEWDALRLTVEETKTNLVLSGESEKLDVQEKLRQLDEIGKEIVDILSRAVKREEECSKLSTELEKRPKMPPRNYYIQRITELTKNSWKQDADIKQIMKETRQLQLEINSIQERLGRTYTVVDEVVFRDAKKDPVRRQAYRLLTSIHESFSQISGTILAINRVKREAADHEAKLASLSSRYFSIDKLQADLDSLRKENEMLEKQRQ